ncbi:MAG: hypothetical protein PHW69_10010 [Elusimicrobiaceae bacterium]|nr:hypothetical protein [Elusimicrobiaceae bacterium]
MKKSVLSVCVVLAGVMPAAALVKGDTAVEVETVWLRLFPKGEASQTYIEAAVNGRTTVRVQSSGKITTRSGKVDKQLVKDLFQEMRGNDVFDSAALGTGRMLFYKGDLLRISAVWEGEIRTVEMPTEKLTQGFRYALDALKKAALKLPVNRKIYRFVAAYPVAEDELASHTDATGRERYRYKYLETSVIDLNPAISRAILRPQLLVPLNSRKESEELYDFFYDNKIRAESGDFMLSTSRGDFKMEIIKATY